MFKVRDMYANYTEALLDKHAQNISPNRLEELVKIFIHATNMETGFWDMGYGYN
jgi:thiaminase